MIKQNKKNAQFNFVWLFAIFAGSAILILAIYGATRINDTSDIETGAKVSKEIIVLIDPMQAGISEGLTSSINFNQETRIDNSCNDYEFGRNSISVSVKKNKEGEFERGLTPVSIKNKYVFSSQENVGKKFIVFSKPFNFPYKVADLTVLVPAWKNYCFINPDLDLKEDIENLRLPNVEVDNCTKEESIKVCFSSSRDCDITINGNEIRKKDSTLKYSGNLLYAGIFSDEEIYDCNVKRLLYRSSKIAEEFSLKSDLIISRNCNTNLKTDMLSWMQATSNATSYDLSRLESYSNEISKKNEREICGLWE